LPKFGIFANSVKVFFC